MVRLLFMLCALHGGCTQVDPMYLSMPDLVCNTRQIALYEEWARKNPEIVGDRRLGRTLCVPVGMQMGQT